MSKQDVIPKNDGADSGVESIGSASVISASCYYFITNYSQFLGHTPTPTTPGITSRPHTPSVFVSPSSSSIHHGLAHGTAELPRSESHVISPPPIIVNPQGQFVPLRDASENLSERAIRYASAPSVIRPPAPHGLSGSVQIPVCEPISTKTSQRIIHGHAPTKIIVPTPHHGTANSSGIKVSKHLSVPSTGLLGSNVNAGRERPSAFRGAGENRRNEDRSKREQRSDEDPSTRQRSVSSSTTLSARSNSRTDTPLNDIEDTTPNQITTVQSQGPLMPIPTQQTVQPQTLQIMNRAPSEISRPLYPNSGLISPHGHNVISHGSPAMASVIRGVYPFSAGYPSSLYVSPAFANTPMVSPNTTNAVNLSTPPAHAILSQSVANPLLYPNLASIPNLPPGALIVINPGSYENLTLPHPGALGAHVFQSDQPEVCE